jgi:hypothetical protein
MDDERAGLLFQDITVHAPLLCGALGRFHGSCNCHATIAVASERLLFLQRVCFAEFLQRDIVFSYVGSPTRSA